ncbi:hypothetical protein QWY84_15835 [Aquisalimonas lutea]|uniref:hypothetical protein n=1 Tax=Aquisalimonas lutea TaxID=1327750 RepID=UPI0025B391FB|nr:hypothetical protein [Aquisalimonas lutea]MDN3519088.1 hypothetical protein [Aquisalimonas lutea]
MRLYAVSTGSRFDRVAWVLADIGPNNSDTLENAIMRTFLIMLSLMLLPSWSGLVLAQSDYGPGAMGGGGSGGMMIIPMLFGLLVLAILILAVMALVKYLRQ